MFTAFSSIPLFNNSVTLYLKVFRFAIFYRGYLYTASVRFLHVEWFKLTTFFFDYLIYNLSSGFVFLQHYSCLIHLNIKLY